jgi:serine/threonine protein kinase
LLEELARAPADEGPAAWQEPLRPGDHLDRFEIRRRIGSGGFGEVYEAHDGDLGRAVALKTLRPARAGRELSPESIRKEAEAVARLSHPGIVTLHDVRNSSRGPYLVMELLEGETLAERLTRGPLPIGEALRLAEEMAQALAHAHGRGVLHRDLKPANAFLCVGGRVKLLDFGLAHLLGTPGGGNAGTPAYMAPEQARGEAVDERADVYAAWVVLGEMLTGKRPVGARRARGRRPPGAVPLPGGLRAGSRGRGRRDPRGRLDRPLPREHLAEHHPGRVDVRALVDGLATRLLRRHVRGRAGVATSRRPEEMR